MSFFGLVKDTPAATPKPVAKTVVGSIDLSKLSKPANDPAPENVSLLKTAIKEVTSTSAPQEIPASNNLLEELQQKTGNDNPKQVETAPVVSVAPAVAEKAKPAPATVEQTSAPEALHEEARYLNFLTGVTEYLKIGREITKQIAEKNDAGALNEKTIALNEALRQSLKEIEEATQVLFVNYDSEEAKASLQTVIDGMRAHSEGVEKLWAEASKKSKMEVNGMLMEINAKKAQLKKIEDNFGGNSNMQETLDVVRSMKSKENILPESLRFVSEGVTYTITTDLEGVKVNAGNLNTGFDTLLTFLKNAKK
jgi:hypothetical protein